MIARPWLTAALGWAIVAILYAAQMLYIARQPGESIVLKTVLFASLAYYLCWIPLTPPVWWISRNWSPDRMRVIALVPRHLALGFVVSSVHAVMSTFVTGLLLDRFLTGVVLMSQIRARVASGLLMYGVIAGAGLALAYYARWRERELAAAQLEAQLTDARLQALRAQLHPHFLFNSLHAVASLVRSGDNQSAIRTIGLLSDLLRRVLDTDARPLVPLAEEAAFAERYFEIQRTRFGDRLRTSIDVEPRVSAAMVPSLLLQPLIENAFRHGLAEREEAGHVAIAARAPRAGQLEITVDDDGAGLPADWNPSQGGVGLRNTRARLQQHYGDAATLAVGPRPGGGTRVTIALPA